MFGFMSHELFAKVIDLLCRSLLLRTQLATSLYADCKPTVKPLLGLHGVCTSVVQFLANQAEYTEV